MEIKYFLLWNFFQDSQLNSSIQDFLNLKFVVKIFPQMDVKVIWICKSKFIFFFLTLNTYILQSMWSKFMKFFSYDLIQVKYKILWLDSEKCSYLFIFDKCKKLSNLGWFGARNWPWDFRGYSRGFKKYQCSYIPYKMSKNSL